MKTWLPWTLFAPSLALNIFLIAGFFWGRSAVAMWRDPESRFEMMADRLDLNEPQRADLKRIMGEMKGRGMDFEAHRQARREIIDMALQPNPDRAAIMARMQQLTQERTQRMTQTLDLFLPFLASLTPEQRAELKEFMEERRERRWGRGWGGQRMGWAN